MTSGRLWNVAAAAAILLGIGAGLAYAAADDAIKGRQACMKSHGEEMKVMVPMFKGEQPFDKAALDAVSAKMAAACADWDKFWAADAQKGETAETWAKPEIWTDMASFKAAGEAWYKASEEVKAANDEASFKAAFTNLGNACKNCHEKFRRPKE
jgi:cytochrome c556